ncbi:MAG TPA: TRAP transporter substrate-binding protein [Clostridiales bacterium]|nr:TRAP transporter substrate-binding protein [Clostridiales bacterium]
MKRSFLLLILSLLMVFSFAACGKDERAEEGNTGESYTITLSHVEPEDRSVHQGAVAFKEYIETESDGRVTVNILPNGQYGGDADSMEAVAQGTLQMTVCVSSVLTSYSDAFMVLDLPFIWDSREAFYYALDNELGADLNATLEDKGLIGFGYNDNGLRQMTNNIRPITQLADFKGIKFRTMESPVFIEMFKLLGASPVPMSFDELYTALQQGTVEGQENGAALVLASKFQEVQKYMSITNHVYSTNAIIANLDWFNTLSAEDQQMIRDGAQKCLIDEQREIERNSDAKAIEDLKAAGMKVNEVSEEAMVEMRNAVLKMYDDYKAKVDAKLFEDIDIANDKF